jgi:inactive STAND
MAEGIEIAGSVERSVIISGDGNHVNLIFRDTRAEETPNSGRAPYDFDRKPQKDALRGLLDASRASVVPLYGASGEGHALLAEYLFQSLSRAGRLSKRVRVTDRDWPRHTSLEARLGALCEQLARRWALPIPALLPNEPARLLAHLNVVQREQPTAAIMVHHVILSPNAADAQLVERYLKTVWQPVFSRKSNAPLPVLVFELHIARRARLLSKLYQWLGLGDSGAAKKILGVLERFAASNDAAFARPPELLPMSQDDLAVLYPHADDADPTQVRDQARALHRATLGQFDAVVAQLYPTEAI